MEKGSSGNDHIPTKISPQIVMNAREIFRLATKIVGFVVILQGLQSLLEAVMLLVGFADLRLSTPKYWVAWGFIKLAVGIYLMVGPHSFADFAFPMKLKAPDETSGR